MSGVKGMHWGVRKNRTPSSMASDHKIKSIKLEARAEEYRVKAKKLRSHPLKQAKAKDYERAAARASERASRHSRKADMYDKIARASMERAAKASFNRRIDPKEAPRHEKTYKKATSDIMTKAAAAIAVGLVTPTAKHFGEQIAKYVASRATS